jgi:hypothetical protein
MNQHPISPVRSATGRHLTTCPHAASSNARIAKKTTIAPSTRQRLSKDDRTIIASIRANASFSGGAEQREAPAVAS